MATRFLAVMAATGLILGGCSSWNSPNKLDQHPLSELGQKKAEKDLKEQDLKLEPGDKGLFGLTGDGGVLGGGSKLSREDMRARKLYAGALDTVMDLPVKTADQSGGFIATDWKVDPSDPTTRYSLNIRVSGQDPYGEVKVVVLKQVLSHGIWTDAVSDGGMARDIEKSIRKQSQVSKM
ncbi:MAG: DUF3576 domain-containing protein [Magnetococcales bacterium]|nr:DUF3576 domain-containing protein [Magnetococcales bacterium]